MGGDKISDEDLLEVGVEIVGRTESGSRMLRIGDESPEGYVQLIKEKLNEGFWNEIVGPEEILFIFRFSDGSVEEYKLTLDNEKHIAELCSQFNGDSLEKTSNVYEYISGNDFYKKIMTNNYSELIDR